MLRNQDTLLDCQADVRISPISTCLTMFREEMSFYGQAHQYQQIIVNLRNDTYCGISLTGAQIGRHLDLVRTRMHEERGWPPEHLGFNVDQNQVLWLTICPEVLLVHTRNAIEKANLLGMNLSFPHISRGQSRAQIPRMRRIRGPFYNFSLTELEACLNSGGHNRL